MLGTLLIAAIALVAILSSLLTIRDQRRREWLERRVWTAPHGTPHARPTYPPLVRS
jgi:hypothetical protein